MEQYSASILVTIWASLFTFFLAFNVGLTRAREKEPAYEKTKNSKVKIAHRVHMNTIESMVVYLPLLWVASVFGSANIAGFIGTIWLGSRVLYAHSYLKDPKKRQIPFMVSVACIAATALLGFYAIIFN